MSADAAAALLVTNANLLILLSFSLQLSLCVFLLNYSLLVPRNPIYYVILSFVS